MSDPSALRRKLDYARRDLLDLTARNRLIHTPRGRVGGRSIEIAVERADAVFAKLVTERKPMGLRPAPEHPHEEGGVSGVASVRDPDPPQHADSFLQTPLPSEPLQKKLLSIFYDSRTFQEEQGVNILYLALGFLRWRDPVTRQDRDAPLLLVPVSLERQNVAARFRLRAEDEDITTNLSLQSKLKGEFAVELPEVPPREDLAPSAYFDRVTAAIAGQPDWSVRPDDMVLGFFSFSKFLMYRDLDPENWALDRRLDAHPAIVALLEAGFRSETPLCGDDDPIDPLVSVAAAAHVVDADSSQTIVIEEVKQGRNLVVQGPPGTGKSQTIANAIALAVREGKKVLFVAEKMAALEVVKRRLDNIGLGAMCLELHSHKARKAAVLEDLAETMQVGRPKRANAEKTVAELQTRRDQLNAVVAGLHEPIEPAGFSAYRILGELVRLRAGGVGAAQFTLGNAAQWPAAEVDQRARSLSDVAEHLRDMGRPDEHPWRGVMLDGLLPMDVDRLIARLPDVGRRLSEAITAAEALAKALGVQSPATPREIGRLARFGDRVA
jgi:hypothetical protein